MLNPIALQKKPEQELTFQTSFLKADLSYIKVCRQQDSQPNIMARHVLLCPSFHLSNILALQLADVHLKTRSRKKTKKNGQGSGMQGEEIEILIMYVSSNPS